MVTGYAPPLDLRQGILCSLALDEARCRCDIKHADKHRTLMTYSAAATTPLRRNTIWPPTSPSPTLNRYARLCRSSSHCLRNDGTTSIKQSAVCFRCKLSTFPCRLYQHQNRAYRLSVTAPLDSAPMLKAFLPIHKPVLRGGYRLPRKSSRVSDSCTNPQRRLSSMPARVVDIAIIRSKVQVSGKAHVHLPSQSSRLPVRKQYQLVNPAGSM